MRYAPHPRLRPYVHSLGVWEQGGATADARELLPDGYVEPVFGGGAPSVIADGLSEQLTPRSYRIGVLAEPVRLRPLGASRVVAARLYAWRAAPLLGAWSIEAPAAMAPLDSSWAATADAIERALNDGEAAAIARLQRALLARLDAAPPVAGRVLAAAHLIRETGGRLPIRAVAARADLSPRHLERAFRGLVGRSPKTLARTVRFEGARDRLWLDPGADLATLARVCGYADQAHLSREFRAFAGQSPARLAARLRTGWMPLARGDIAFLQDDGHETSQTGARPVAPVPRGRSA